MKKERLARGWSILELAGRMSVDPAHLGRVESGKRPRPRVSPPSAMPSSRNAGAGFGVSRRIPALAEVPATFKSWPEYEDRAASLRDWSPSIVTGLLQTEEYARALISVQPHITQETATARLANRMQRQQRVMARENPPTAWFIVDELCLYREVGSAGAWPLSSDIYEKLPPCLRSPSRCYPPSPTR